MTASPSQLQVPPLNKVEAREVRVESLEEQVKRIGKEYGASSYDIETMLTIMQNESLMGEKREGDFKNGKPCAFGLVHLNICQNPDLFTEEQARNDEFSLRFLAEKVTKGEEWRWWTLCSCIQTAKLLGVKVPRGMSAKDLVPNSGPVVGGLVLMKYGRDYHVGVIESIKDEGSEKKISFAEGNMERCKFGRRTLNESASEIIGFVVF